MSNAAVPNVYRNAAIFVAAAVVLHVTTFVGLGQLVPGSVFVTTGAIGFVLGGLAWVLFQARWAGRFWLVFWTTIVGTLIAAGLLMVVRLETGICLVIGLPLFAPGAALGILAARNWQARRGDGPKLRVALLGLPLLVAAVEGQVAWPRHDAVVTTEVEIAAPPAVVWAQTLEIPAIRPSERIWTLSHHLLGAPQPISAKLHGDHRQLVWTKGVRFSERVTERVEQERLAWDFVFDSPDSLDAFDPHVSPDSYRLKLTTGQYVLESIDGGTRLTLQSRYRLHTPVNRYLTWWGELFLQDFHRSVLAVIKTRSETEVAT